VTAAQRTRWWVKAGPFLAFVVVALFVAVPILIHPYLPLADLPNHIARLHIAATVGGPLAEFYRYSVQLVPNTSADLVWFALGFPGDVVVFAQWTMVFYAVSLIAATMILARQIHGRWTIWSAASGLVVYNACFYWGFQNYLLSLPFAIAGLALWLGTERWRPSARIVLFVLYGFGLFVLHFFSFVALALMACGREVQGVIDAPKGRRGGEFLRRLPMSLPFVLPTAWLAMRIVTSPPSVAGSDTAFGALFHRLESLISPVLTLKPWLGPSTEIAGLAVLYLLGVCVMLAFRRSGFRLVMARAALGPGLMVLVVGLLSPFLLNSVAYTNIRWPVVGVLVLIAGSDWQGATRRQMKVLALTVVALLAARGISFEAAARHYSADVADYLAVTSTLPPGARVLPMRSPGQMPDVRLWHLDAYAVIKRQAFVPMLFQGVHDLQVLPQWAGSTHAQGVPPDIRLVRDALTGPAAWPYLEDWTTKFTFAVLLDSDSTTADTMPELHKVAQNGRFTLYQIRDPA
jgi:hypothetical protein